MLPILYTIGHGTRRFAQIVDLLDRHGIRTVIDVRSHPTSSRAPHFSHPELADALGVLGLGYRWMGDRLGGRPTDPELLAPNGSIDWERLRATPSLQAAADEVAEVARHGGVVLLCGEAEPDHCHRSFLLAPEMEGRGMTVHHILGDGTLRAHQPGLFPPPNAG